MNMHASIETPWGWSQSTHRYADGIDFYSTAGHGGLRLSPLRWADLTSSFDFHSFAGPGWLEEDCDFAFAVIRWPELFDADTVHSCVRDVLRGSGPGCDSDNYFSARRWLRSPAGEPARRTAQEFAASVAGQWERGGMSGDKDGWQISFRRDGDYCLGLMTDYPAKNWYTEAEVAPLRAALDAFVARKARERIARESQRPTRCTADLCPSDADSGL